MKRSKPKKNEYPAFTNFTIKVHVNNSWQDTVKLVLKSVEGVTSFRMEDDGKINISGYIEPSRLLKNLKKAGKKAEMVHWQYGECSNNLFQNTQPPANDNIGPHGPSYNGPGYGYGNYNHGYGYGYGYGYGRNYAYNHLECSGNAQDCNGHHMDQSSFSISKKITANSEEDPLPPAPKCCSLM